ncbi:MAG: hypothetical protein PHC50_03405 [Candidatus Cloacimonetes bacterium]|nr:hypothetical protein [Candidatus Cloacimonadota bacterium]
MQESYVQNDDVNNFSDFGDDSETLEGEKMKIDDLLNQDLIVRGYRIKETKFPKKGGSPYCLTLQIELNSELHVVFSGCIVLVDQIRKYAAKIPFRAQIVKIGNYYKFKSEQRNTV